MQTPRTSTFRALLIIRGFLLIAFGLLALSYPGLTVVGLVYFIGAMAIISGILAFVHSFTERNWYYLIPGFFEIFLGILIMAYPAITASIVVWLFVIWLIAMGIVITINGIAGVTILTGVARVLMVIAGLVIAFFAVYLILQPVLITGLNLVWLMGIFSFLAGIPLILTAIFAKKETISRKAKESLEE